MHDDADTPRPILASMYDVLVLAPGGGWRTDLCTGSRRYAVERHHHLTSPARTHRAVARVLDAGGRQVTS